MIDDRDFDKVWSYLQEAQDLFDGTESDEELEAVELIIAALQPSGWSPAAMFERERQDAERCTCCSEADCVCDGRTACCAN